MQSPSRNAGGKIATYWTGRYCVISYDSENNLAMIDWLDYNPSDQFREASEQLIKLVSEKKLAKVLNNTEQLRIIPATEQAWVSSDFLPRLITAGVQVIAMVNSLHYFARVGASGIMQRFDPSTGVVVEYFNSKESAREWLTNIPITGSFIARPSLNANS